MELSPSRHALMPSYCASSLLSGIFVRYSLPFVRYSTLLIRSYCDTFEECQLRSDQYLGKMYNSLYSSSVMEKKYKEKNPTNFQMVTDEMNKKESDITKWLKVYYFLLSHSIILENI